MSDTTYARFVLLLLRSVKAMFRPSVDRSERERETLERDDGRHTVEVSLHQTEDLARLRGRTPEKTAANFVAQALDDAGLDYRIDYGFEDLYSPPAESNDVEVLRWWADESPGYAENANILLYDARGGGRAGLGGDHAIAGTNRVKRVVEATPECERESCDNVWAVIHELGHSFGGRHTTPIMEPKPKLCFHSNMKDLIHERVEDGDIP